jgi:hypothetical protein
MTSDLVWVLIRQDDGANRYRVGRYATRAEAERIAGQLDGRSRRRGHGQEQGHGQVQEQDHGQQHGRQHEQGAAGGCCYVIERIAPRMAQA